MTATVTVLRDRYVRGWPRHERGSCADPLPLGRALTNTYATDAHFAAYVTPNRRRLTREALDQGMPIELTVIAFDIDCPSVHGTFATAPDAWRAEFLASVDELSSAHPGPFVYMTRGGARVVYRQTEPTVLRTQSDAQRWSQRYAVWIAYLRRRVGMVADPACADWQRLYRLPHATRVRGREPESRPRLGDPWHIRPLVIAATDEDVASARVTSKAFHQRSFSTFTPCTSDGAGLLYHLLRARGALVRAHVAGSYVIRCPREAEHSRGSTGDGSTLLYPPAAGERVGAIHCMHAHCSHMRVRDWVHAFSDHELEVARNAARIARVG